MAATQAGLDTHFTRHSFTLTSKREGQWGFKRELFEVESNGKQSLLLVRTRTKASLRMQLGGFWNDHAMDVSETTSAMLLVRQFAPLPRFSGLRRNAKGKLEKLVANDDPISHQLELTRNIDIQRLRALSRSFDKLVRTLGALCRVEVPPRPS
jgi:hypothetical protein